MEVKDAEKKNPPAPAAGAPGASEGDTPAKGDQEAAFKRITAERDTAKKERAEVSKKLQEAEDRLQRLEANLYSDQFVFSFSECHAEYISLRG